MEAARRHELASLCVNDGRSFHHCSNDALSDGFWHRPFDLFCQLDHGGDCRAAVRGGSGNVGDDDRGGNGQGEPASERKPGEPPAFTRLLTGAELLALDLRPRFLVRGVLVEGQPMIIGGRSKTLKT